MVGGACVLLRNLGERRKTGISRIPEDAVALDCESSANHSLIVCEFNVFFVSLESLQIDRIGSRS